MELVDLLNFVPVTISTITIVYLFLWALKHPKRVREWGRNIKDAFGWISDNLIPRWKRWRKAQWYQKPLNKGLKGLKEEGLNADKLKAKVSVNKKLLDKRPVVKRENSKVLVSVLDDEPTPSNFVIVVMELVKVVILPNVRACMEREVNFVMTLVLTKKMLEKSQKKGALTYFSKEILAPSLDHMVVCGLYEELLRIDERGWFTRILGRVFQDLETTFSYLPERCRKLEMETRLLIDYLYKIAMRERGEYPPLSFFGEYIRISIILVGSLATRTLIGTEAYVKRLNEELDKGMLLVLIIGVGEWNVDFVKEILRANTPRVESPSHSKAYYATAFGNLPAMCIPLYRKDSTPGQS